MIRRKLIGSQIDIDQERNHSFNLDTVLLAKFLNLPARLKTLLDVGTGNGALLLYASEMTKANLFGVEIQEERFQMAKHNIQLNHLEHRSKLILGDYLNTSFKNLDCIICNPPFFKTAHEDQLSLETSDQIARHEQTLSLSKLIAKVSEQLKFGGYFYMVHRADRFAEIVFECKKHQLAIKRVKFVHPYLDKKANHVLIQCIKNGKDSLVLEPPLILYKDKHEHTDMFHAYIKGDI